MNIKNAIRKLVDKKKNKKKQKKSQSYTNIVTFTDIDGKVMKARVKTISDKAFLYISDAEEKEKFLFDQDAAIFLSAILSDFVENGNLNKVEEILKPTEESEEQ